MTIFAAWLSLTLWGGWRGGWDLAEQSDRCTSMLKVAGLNASGGIESTFCSDLLLTARDSNKK
jgi:hypothetical protein